MANTERTDKAVFKLCPSLHVVTAVDYRNKIRKQSEEKKYKLGISGM